MFKTLLLDGKTTPLYYHRTDSGQEYLYDTFIESESGHREGVITKDTKVLLRIDGQELEIIKLG